MDILLETGLSLVGIFLATLLTILFITIYRLLFVPIERISTESQTVEVVILDSEAVTT